MHPFYFRNSYFELDSELINFEIFRLRIVPILPLIHCLRRNNPMWASTPWATCRTDRLSTTEYRPSKQQPTPAINISIDSACLLRRPNTEKTACDSFLLGWYQHGLASKSIASQCSQALPAPLGRTSRSPPRFASRQAEVRCIHGHEVSTDAQHPYIRTTTLSSLSARSAERNFLIFAENYDFFRWFSQ